MALLVLRNIVLPLPPPKWSAPWIKSEALTARDWLINQLPNVGGIGGGLAGGAAGIESGPGALAARAGGSAAGGFVGSEAQQHLTQHFHPEDPRLTESEIAKRAGVEAAKQAGYEALGMGVGKGIKAIPKVGKLVSSEIRPSEEIIKGERVTQLPAERNPAGIGSGAQRSLKRAGIGKKGFEAVAEGQQESAKKIIRKSVQDSAHTPIAIGEPSEMAEAGSSGLKTRASRLYNQVWASRVEVPFDTQTEKGLIPASGPVRDAWNRVVRRLAVPDDVLVSPNKPIQLMHQFRSELAAAAEGSRDRATGKMDTAGLMLSDEAKNINDLMRNSLKQNPRALLQWETANGLWGRARSLDLVAEALAKVTKGTPPAFQVGGKSARLATEIQGGSFVSKLNDLDREGVLDNAFPDGGKGVRAVADMLERAQEVRASDPALSKLNYITRYGAELTLAGGAGAIASHARKGQQNVSFAAAAVLAFLGARWGENVIAKMMTDETAYPLITKLASATSTEQVSKFAEVLNQLAPTIVRGEVQAVMPRGPKTQQLQRMADEQRNGAQ